MSDPATLTELIPQLGSAAAVVIVVALFLKYMVRERELREKESAEFLAVLREHTNAITALTVQCERRGKEERSQS